MKYNIPKNPLFVLERLSSLGYESYIVGGCVRDMLLGKTPHDYDICTSATPEETIEAFSDYNVIKTGLKHGTVTIVVKGEHLEVTTYRTEGSYSDNRRPDSVSFVKDLKSDLARRDFTINALAYNHSAGIVDFFGGREDLASGIIRAVGSPQERFSEDALRIMRAIRFASTYDFAIEENTANSIHQLAPLLNNIAKERINTELCKLLMGSGVEQVLLDYSDVISVIIPEVALLVGFDQRNPHHIYDIYTHSVKAVANSPSDIIVRLTMLLHDIEKPSCYTVGEDGIGHFYEHGRVGKDTVIAILKNLKFDNDTVKKVSQLVLFHDGEIHPSPRAVKRWLSKIGKEELIRLIYVKNADDSSKNPDKIQGRVEKNHQILDLINKIELTNQCFSLKSLAITGEDLMAIGIPQGKIVGAILKKLMEMVIEEEIDNNCHSLLEKAEELYEGYNS